MTDSAFNQFVNYGTHAARLAYTPSPPTPASGPSPLYIWYETDTGNTYGYDTSWRKINTGGGGPTTMGISQFSGVGTPAHDFYLFTLVNVTDNITLSKIAFQTANATASAKYQPFVYSDTGGPDTLLASGPQIIGVTAGFNEAPFTAPVTLNRGDRVWLGISGIVADITNFYQAAGGRSAFLANGGSSVPAATVAGATQFNSANSIYAFWGEA